MPKVDRNNPRRSQASESCYDKVGLEYRRHHRIRHADSIYVSGNVHTQTIEGFFSNLKRGIAGNYHSVSTKWLQGYLNEFVWRYNRRYVRKDGKVVVRMTDRAMFLLLVEQAAAVERS